MNAIGMPGAEAALKRLSPAYVKQQIAKLGWKKFVAGEMTGGIHGRNRLMGNGITDSLVRLSLGVEDCDDLVADLEQALAAV